MARRASATAATSPALTSSWVAGGGPHHAHPTAPVTDAADSVTRPTRDPTRTVGSIQVIRNRSVQVLATKHAIPASASGAPGPTSAAPSPGACVAPPAHGTV